MDSDHERLAGRLEELRRALLATESYRTQLRTIVAEIQQDLTRLADATAERAPSAAGPPSGY